jgi:hypothetical protein
MTRSNTLTNVATARRSAAALARVLGASALAGLALVAATGRAAAQTTYVGNAYGARADVSVLAGTALVNARIADTGNLPAPGGNLTNGVANASLTAGLLNSINVLNSGVVNTATSGAGGLTDSSATVNNLTLFDNFLNIGSIVPNIVALLSADVVTSQTTATTSGTTGSSVITNLRFGGSQVTPTGALNQTLYLSALGSVNTSAGVGDLARLVLNQQLINGDGSRTTNAINLTVLSSPLLGVVANSQVIVSSSTAGLTTVVPEPGTAGLAAAGLLPLAGAVVARRRRARRVA